MRFTAQAIKDGSELQRNVATTYHQYPLGLLLQKEHLIGVGHELLAGDIRQHRPTAGSQQNVPGCMYLTVDLDPMRAGNASMAVEQGDAAVFQQTAIDVVQPPYFPVFVFDQGRPVKALCACIPAVTVGQLNIFTTMSSIRHELFGHATNIDTGAA